ncbi:MFS transporter [Bacillus shivajii]|uniref:MFS transporter n=1 Tax=Bacillus shivajii TaxID=1983719 RepID=UPI001CFB447C|nr:MFS transporter [Bacillus shivajii]UCZ55054.1 MFS transporter [Bacillus shivajii]
MTSKFKVFIFLSISHFISLLGSAMTRFGLGVFAFQETGQVFNFALVLVFGFLPGIILSPLAGVWIDRKGPRLLLLVGNMIGTVAIFSASMLIITTNLNMWQIMIITSALSCVSALQSPALHTLVPMLIPEGSMSRANGILSTVTSASDVLGPVTGGILIAFSGLTLIIFIDLLTYIIVLITILMLWTKLSVSLNEQSRDQDNVINNTWSRDFKDGFSYLTNNKPLFHLVLLFTCLNMAMGFHSVLGQPYILSIGTVQDYGMLSSLFGLGMVIGD